MKAVRKGRDVADRKWRQLRATRDNSVKFTKSTEYPQLSKGVDKGRMCLRAIYAVRGSLSSQGNTNHIRCRAKEVHH